MMACQYNLTVYMSQYWLNDGVCEIDGKKRGIESAQQKYKNI